jgi:L-arabinokinase
VSSGVAFYISGHGFGHASRQVEIINAFGARCPDARILVRSAAARWLLERTIEVPFELDPRPADTGVIQIDSLHLDAGATIAAARDFHATLPARADAEAGWLRANGVALVIADAPPLACVAAAAAGVPAIVVANFTWDWIYQAFTEHLAPDDALIATIQDAYRHAAAAWRLPLHGGFETFEPRASVLVNVPLVARHSSRAPRQTRERLGLPQETRLVLPSFGGYGIQGLDLKRVQLPAGWAIVQGLEQAEIYDAGLSYQDLVRAVDVVITKPGYGIVSECVANDTPVVYTSRGRFAEYDVFVREMPAYLRCAFIDHDALLAGRWRAAIDAAVDAPPPPERPRTDGAVVVAEMMAAVLAGRSPADARIGPGRAMSGDLG